MVKIGMAHDIRTFRKAAVMGGFLSRASELGFSPEEAEGLLLKTAGAIGGALVSMAPTAATIGMGSTVLPYFAGKAVGGLAGSGYHNLERSVDRLDDPDMITLKRRLIQILQMNREVEGDLSVKNLNPVERTGRPAGHRRPSSKPKSSSPRELVD